MRARLGDDIDDYCAKCKRIMNHSVVSLLNDEPAKVRCRTCHSDHDYRNEQAPPPKADSRKAALFNEVLANVQGGAPVPEAVSTPEPVSTPEDAAGNKPAAVKRKATAKGPRAIKKTKSR